MAKVQSYLFLFQALCAASIILSRVVCHICFPANSLSFHKNEAKGAEGLLWSSDVQTWLHSQVPWVFKSLKACWPQILSQRVWRLFHWGHSKTTRALVFLAYWLNLEQYHTKKAWLERLTEDALSNFRRSHFLITIHSLAWEAFTAKPMIARIQRLLVQLVHTSAVNRRSNRRSFNCWVWSGPSWGTDVENVTRPRETWRWKQVTLMCLRWSSCDCFCQSLNLFISKNDEDRER